MRRALPDGARGTCRSSSSSIPYAGEQTSRAAQRSTSQLRERVNDFAFKIANVNGTGSASANGLLMQAIFRMGIPVSGKNVFPSNIQGLPTWYEIRVSKDGYTARTPDFDLMVAHEPGDVREGRRGGARRRLAALRLDRGRSTPSSTRDDVTFLGIPFARDVQRERSRARASAS